MRVCYFGTYQKDFPTNRVLIEGLRRNGVEVVECHVPLWEKTRTKGSDYFGIPSLLALGIRYLVSCLVLSVKIWRVGRLDAIIIGFNGHLDLLLGRVVAWVRRCVLVFNPGLAIYDAIVVDKQFIRAHSLRARLVLEFERFLCKLPDAIFLDSEEHFRFWEGTMGCAREKYFHLYLGADDRLFYPRKALRQSSRPRVLFYGKLQPLQGALYVVKAAKLLEDEGIEFQIVGSGPDEVKVRDLLGELQPSNVMHCAWLDPEELAEQIASADVCLGIFGTSPKYQRCIPNKVIQALAMGKPVVTGRTKAMQELLRDREHVVFCPPGDAAAIAESVRLLIGDPQLACSIASEGHLLFLNNLSPQAVGHRAALHLEALLSSRLSAPA